MTALSSGRDPALGPFSHLESGSSSEGLGVQGRRVPAPSYPFGLSHLVVLGFLPPSCAISAQPGCSPPWSPAGPAQSPRAGGVWGRRVKLPSLSVCPGPPCCLDGAALPCPHVFGVRLSVFLLFFYIEAPGPVPTPQPRTAVNLSVVKNSAALLPASASALFLIKCGGPSLPWTPLFLWEDSGVDRWAEAAYGQQSEGPRGPPPCLRCPGEAAPCPPTAASTAGGGVTGEGHQGLGEQGLLGLEWSLAGGLPWGRAEGWAVCGEGGGGRALKLLYGLAGMGCVQ